MSAGQLANTVAYCVNWLELSSPQRASEAAPLGQELD